MLVPSKYIKTQAERLNVLPAFIYVEREPDFVLAASVSGANLATELCCLVQGMSYAATAETLGVDARTVKFHVSNMLQKTNFENKLQLAIAAIEARLTANFPED